MKLQYSPTTDAELHTLLRSMASDETVEGLLVLATPGDDLHSPELVEVLSELPVPVFGGLFPELIHRDEKKEQGAVVAGLAVEPAVTTVSELSNPEARYETQLDAGLVEEGYETVFVFVDAYATEVERFIEMLFRSYGVEFNFIGGGAGALDMQQRPCLFTNDGLVEDAAVFAAVETPSSIGVRHGWQEVGGPFRVTDANGPRLETLDGEPAFSVYREVVEEHSGSAVTEAEFFEVAKSHPFGISRMDAEKIVRDPFEVTDDGALNCFGDVPEGGFIHILRGDPDALVEAASGAYDDALSGDVAADALFFFDCISRVLYLQDEFERELSAVVDEEVPVLGALTIGEIANDGKGHLDYYNKTAVVGVTENI